ncbi:unnamed protein product, partial [Urochloa humidicola]
RAAGSRALRPAAPFLRAGAATRPAGRGPPRRSSARPPGGCPLRRPSRTPARSQPHPCAALSTAVEIHQLLLAWRRGSSRVGEEEQGALLALGSNSQQDAVVKAMAEFQKGTPQVGLRFKSLDEAWIFWVAYGGCRGFDVRKRYANVSTYDGKVTSCRFVCSNEGHRRKRQSNKVSKCFRAETRIDCKARMSLILDRGAENYEVTDVVLEHNHLLHLPETCHLMATQRKISEVQALEIEAADDSGIRPKDAHELASRQVGGPLNLSYTCRDLRNYLRTRRQRELAFGQAGSMLKHFHDKIVENPSFQYTFQLDIEDHITNIFWADAKMILDYAHFDDVVTFDTTFGTNKEYRPFGVFLGLNQFRETTIFGAAILFDETEDSFLWLFRTFLAAHNGKQPRTIYTDQDAAMGKAIPKVFTDSYHGLCTFHIMQNAVKHLSPVKEDEAEGEKEDQAEGEKEEQAEGEKESHILSDFSACMFGYEDKAVFEEAFDIMRSKVHKQTWLDSIYKVREKWAECYMRDVFSLGVRSIQLSESFNNALKNHLKSGFDIVRFLKHFERTVEDKRAKELQSEFEARKNIPRRLFRTPMLVQASEVYTPVIFEAFQGEYERSMAACSTLLDENRYAIAIRRLHGALSFEEERIVIGDPLNQTATCSCRNGRIKDKQGRNVVENPKLDAQLRTKNLFHKFLNLAYKAANYPDCCLLLEDGLDCLSTQLEDKLKLSTNALNELCTAQEKENVEPNVQQKDELLAAQLKKKEVSSKNSRRKKTFLEKLPKGNRSKPTKSAAPKKSAVPKKKEPKKRKQDDGVQPPKEVENDGSHKGAIMDVEEYNVIGNFTQLVTAPICDDDLLQIDSLF